MPYFIGHSRPLIIPMTASTSTVTIPSQSSAVPNIFTQWVKVPLDSPGMQRQKPLPGFVGITKSSPKMETELESTGALLQTPPEKKSDIPTSTGRGTDPTLAGGVHHGDEPSSPGCMGNNDC